MKIETKTILRFLPLFILGGLVALAYSMGWHQALSFETLQAKKEGFQAFTADKPLLSALAFIGAYIASVALSLPIATLLTLLGGFLFGKWLGTLLVVTGATIGASIIFTIAKTSLGESLRNKAGDLYNRVSKNMEENAFGYLLFMRLVPLFPFVLVNIVPALFNVSLRTFVITTFVGILPGSFVFVNLGETLGDINALGDLVSTQTLLSFALLGFFALIPTLYKQFKGRGAAKAALVVPALALLVMPFSANANDYGRFVALYDGLLGEHIQPVTSPGGVSYNGVDYGAWAEDERHKEARDVLLSIDPSSFGTKDETLAFWMNTYNFLTIDLITREGEEQSIKNLGSTFVSPWKKHKWDIAGASYSLDQIEHKIIRPMDEPRIHFAINCAALSCPDLRSEAYKADILNRQLNEQTVATLNNPSKVFSYDEARDVASVSKIMDWFDEDFNDGDIKAWLKTYKPNVITADTKIKFLKYDWSLNKAL